MTNHTATPWEIRYEEKGTWYGEGWAIVYGADGDIVALIPAPHNAPLIRSAPDLVAALKAVEWVYDSEIDGLFCPTCALPKPTHTRGCQLAAALAKAKENTAHEARLQQRDLDEETL